MSTRTPSRGRVLISGASIAGPTLAYWLRQHGFDVTIVERAPAIRGGGYPIDVRGTALDVVERMGLLQGLWAAHIDMRRITFIGPGGEVVGVIRPEELTGGVEERDLELPRGELTSKLFELTEGIGVTYRFSDAIAGICEKGDAVEVSFKRGDTDRFDLVIGADGIHSNTRRLVFGPEEAYSRYLGYTVAGFAFPNDLGLAHESVTYASPGRVAVLTAARESDTLHGFLNAACPSPPPVAPGDSEAFRRWLAERFEGQGWESPRLVEAMLRADDPFLDVVSQIHMPQWSQGRVALVGDAAYAPSFLTGQGTSLAIVGAYVLAGELATRGTHEEAFEAYEDLMRPFVAANQALATGGATFLLPRTEEELTRRNRAIAEMAASTSLPGNESRSAHHMASLPDYQPVWANRSSAGTP